MFAYLGRLTTHRPRTVVAAWLALVIVAVVAALTGIGGDGLFDRLRTGEPSVPGSESQEGRAILADASTTGEQISLVVEGLDLADPEQVTGVADALAPAHAELGEIDGVARVVDPFLLPGALENPAAAGLISTSQDGFLLVVMLDDVLDDDARSAAHEEVVDRLAAVPDDLAPVAAGASGIVSSPTILADVIVEQVRADLVTGEVVALPVALLIMVLVFGGFLAAGLPLVGALASITAGLGAVLAMTYAIDVDSFVINVVTVLGLGLSVDYGLLIVSRYREEIHRATGAQVPDADDGAVGTRARRRRRRGGPSPLVEQAVVATVSTAGRTVVFSALTVAFAVAGLLVLRPEVLRSIASSGVAIILLAVLSAVTLVPALITLLGERMLRPSMLSRIPGLRSVVARLGDAAPDEGHFSWLARRVQKHPWLVLAGVLAVLGVLASPVQHLELRNSTVELLPSQSDQRDYLAVLAEDYPGSSAPDVTIVTDGAAVDVAAWSAEVAAVEHVSEVAPPVETGEYTVLNVFVDTQDPGGEEATAVVDDVRGLDPAFETWVVGQAANQSDFNAALMEGLPLAASIIALAVFVLLFLMTGSLLVPLKAIIVNVISLSASLGVTVWVFQQGHGAGLLGFTPVAGLESYVVAVALAFGFGLAMDYEVFLLSRIKELWDAGLDNDESVVRGLQRSGRIITSAALIIVAVFAGFVAGDLIVIKQVGVALAVTVLIDATLVRMLLVPATMTLLGRWNWWAPAPLRRLYARFRIIH